MAPARGVAEADVGDIERAVRDGAPPERKAVMQAVVAEIRVRDRGHIAGRPRTAPRTVGPTSAKNLADFGEGIALAEELPRLEQDVGLLVLGPLEEEHDAAYILGHDPHAGHDQAAAQADHREGRGFISAEVEEFHRRRRREEGVPCIEICERDLEIREDRDVPDLVPLLIEVVGMPNRPGDMYLDREVTGILDDESRRLVPVGSAPGGSRSRAKM